VLPQLLATSSVQGGVFTHRQALLAGYSAAEIRHRVESGRWYRLARGGYVAAAGYDAEDAAGRHRLLVGATLLVRRSPAVASHASAAVLHGLPLLGPPPDAVHLTVAGRGRRRPGLVVHEGPLTADETVEVAGLPATTVARTVMDLARQGPFRSAVVVADAALARGLSREQLEEQLRLRHAIPGIRRASRAVRFAAPGAESPGESLSRVAIAAHGLPVPELQAVLFDAAGFVARVDFLFRAQGTVGEFDGALKYTDRTVLLAEKVREDRVRALGLEVVRWGWDAAFGDFGPTAARLWAAFARAGGRRSA
jgi:hypothetical protein